MNRRMTVKVLQSASNEDAGRKRSRLVRLPSLLSRLARSWAVLGCWYSELDDAQVSKRKNDDDSTVVF